MALQDSRIYHMVHASSAASYVRQRLFEIQCLAALQFTKVILAVH